MDLCRRCVYAAGIRNVCPSGVCTCPQDRAPVVDHARNEQCPLGLFGKVDASAGKKPWPLAARLVARCRQRGDQGVGDTVRQLIKGIKGDVTVKMALWFCRRLTGRPCRCGCDSRRAWLNNVYPYR
jgi:hypothetical protein